MKRQRDRNKLSAKNALTIAEYIIAMKREINPRLSYIKNTIQILSEFSRYMKQKPFKKFQRTISRKRKPAGDFLIEFGLLNVYET